jgi:hypothetical protein
MNQRPELCASRRSLAARDAVIDRARRDVIKQLNALNYGNEHNDHHDHQFRQEASIR